jgi:hypothetical protein
MKKYDREKRRWVDEKELTKKQGKRKLCRGGRPHDFQLALPSYVKVVGYPTQEGIVEYYKIEEAKKTLIKQENEKLIKFGIILNDRFGFGRDTKYFICSVCGKQDYEF